MISKRISIPATTIILIVMFAGCSSTRLTSVYKDKDYRGGALKNVMVVGVGQNERDRRLFEETFSAMFEQNNVIAHPSFATLPSEEDLNKETIVAEAEKVGAEAIFVTHFHGVKTKTVYNPPEYGYLGRPDYYGRFDSYYPMVYGYVHRQGYYTEHEIVDLESNLYDLPTEKLIWSAASETVDPRTAKEVIDSLAAKVLNSLRKSGLLP